MNRTLFGTKVRTVEERPQFPVEPKLVPLHARTESLSLVKSIPRVHPPLGSEQVYSVSQVTHAERRPGPITPENKTVVPNKV